jgi:hypothetical protein
MGPLKISVVEGQAEQTIYLYEEREGWVYSAQVALRLTGCGDRDLLSRQAARELSNFLNRATSRLHDECQDLELVSDI